MTAIHVEVTAEDIAAFPAYHKEWDGPVRRALEELTAEQVDIDGDDDVYVATIGQGAWTLVLDLPVAACRFLDRRWENEGPGVPFAFDIDVPAWVVDLVTGAPR